MSIDNINTDGNYILTSLLFENFFTVLMCPRLGLNESVPYNWDQVVRNGLSSIMQSIHSINDFRHNSLVPGEQLDLASNESCVPVLLLQFPGVQLPVRSDSFGETPPLRFSIGWDVVLGQ